MPETFQFLSLTNEARRYGLKELARRAGVSREFFATWQIEVAPAETVVTLVPNGAQKVRFPHATEDLLQSVAAGNFPVTYAGRFGPRVHRQPQDFVLPFFDSKVDAGVPLFTSSGKDEYLCRGDLLFSLVLTLARVEETICAARDEHGRFPASASLASRHEFLERPIVDEYGLAFEQVLSALLPLWKAQRTPLRLKLTHDVDVVGIPFELRSSVGHALKRRNLKGSVRNLLAAFTAAEPLELVLVRDLAEISRQRGHHSSFYWKASPPGPKDSGYDPGGRKIQRVIRDLAAAGCEMGVHPGYDTFRAPSELEEEVERLRRAIGNPRPGGRQHYLRWAPQTWLDWEHCGLTYDSTLGYADRIGFRAGTSLPFRPWNLEQNRELNLLEIPLIVMDCTPVKYMRLSREQGLARIKGCIENAARAGGVFTLLWHNAPLMEPEYDGWYERVLDLLNGVPSFELPTSPDSLW